jgi:hypothetical protein
MASAIKEAQYIVKQLDDLINAVHSRERVVKAQHVAERMTLLQHLVVAEARQREMSWGAIGEVFGCTRQAAQQRFGGG